ncbi:hypothetical protein PMS11_10345 [Bifidobacterium longum]|nr:hypothetical protein [Bifidobacterium longum]
MEKQTMWRLVWSQVQEASKPLMTDRGEEEWTMYGPPSRMWQPDPDHFTATVSLEKLADCDEWEHVDSETAKGSDSTDPQPFDEAKARLLERHGLADSDISDEIPGFNL